MYQNRKLRELYRNDPCIGAIINVYGKRQRTKPGALKYMPIELRKANCYYSIEEIYDAVEKLEATGYVSIERKKDKGEAVIRWRVALRDIYAAATVSGDQLESKIPERKLVDTTAAVGTHSYDTSVIFHQDRKTNSDENTEKEAPKRKLSDEQVLIVVKQLEDENSRLKKLFAEVCLKREMLEERLRENGLSL